MRGACKFQPWKQNRSFRATKSNFNVLNNFRNLQSLLGSHGSQWLLFRVSYALRKRTGLIRLRLPIYQWQDRPLETWLKNGIPSKPEAYAEWRSQNSPNFFFNPRAPEKYRDYSKRNDEGSSRHADEARFPSNLSWNPQTAVDEAE